MAEEELDVGRVVMKTGLPQPFPLLHLHLRKFPALPLSYPSLLWGTLLQQPISRQLILLWMLSLVCPRLRLQPLGVTLPLALPLFHGVQSVWMTLTI